MKRNTIQRQLVLDSVTELKNHPTAEEVYNKIKQKYPDISMGTVYRNLNDLAAESRINKISIPGAADRFDHITEPHYHLKCAKCGGVFDIRIKYMADLDGMAREATGFRLYGHQTIFLGECSSCK